MGSEAKCPDVCDQHLGTLDTSVAEHHKALFDSEHGLANCIKKKVSWIHLGTVVFSLCILMVGLSGFFIYAAEKKDERVVKVEETATVTAQKAEIIKKDIQHIKEDMAEQKADIKEIKNTMVKKEDLDAKFDLIIKAIIREH